MRQELCEHYTAELLAKLLEELATKFPLEPLRPILQNYLYQPDGNSGEPVIKEIARGFYRVIQYIQKSPDEYPVAKQKESEIVIEGVEPCK